MIIKNNATITLTKAQIQALKDASAVIVVSNGNVDVQIPASILPLAKNLDIKVKKMQANGALASMTLQLKLMANCIISSMKKLNLHSKLNQNKLRMLKM